MSAGHSPEDKCWPSFSCVAGLRSLSTAAALVGRVGGDKLP